MKILLVEPPKAAATIGGEEVFLFEPLGLEYVAAGVVKDQDVRLLDMRLDRNLALQLEEFNPDVVGFTAYTVHVNTVCGLAAAVKKWNPKALTVVGGQGVDVVTAGRNRLADVNRVGTDRPASGQSSINRDTFGVERAIDYQHGIGPAPGRFDSR